MDYPPLSKKFVPSDYKLILENRNSDKPSYVCEPKYTCKVDNTPCKVSSVDKSQLPEACEDDNNFIGPETIYHPYESSRPYTSVPQTDRPQTRRPQTGRPETGRPQTGRPETGRPETGRPYTSTPKTNRPQTDKPVTYIPSSISNTLDEITKPIENTINNIFPENNDSNYPSTTQPSNRDKKLPTTPSPIILPKTGMPLPNNLNNEEEEIKDNKPKMIIKVVNDEIDDENEYDRIENQITEEKIIVPEGGSIKIRKKNNKNCNTYLQVPDDSAYQNQYQLLPIENNPYYAVVHNKKNNRYVSQSNIAKNNKNRVKNINNDGLYYSLTNIQNINKVNNDSDTESDNEETNNKKYNNKKKNFYKFNTILNPITVNAKVVFFPNCRKSMKSTAISSGSAKFIVDKRNNTLYYKININQISSDIIIIQINYNNNKNNLLYIPLCGVPYNNGNLEVTKSYHKIYGTDNLNICPRLSEKSNIQGSIELKPNYRIGLHTINDVLTAFKKGKMNLSIHTCNKQIGELQGKINNA